MSFSIDLKKELSEIKNKKFCCRLSFLCGLFVDSEYDENNVLTLNVTGEELCRLVVKTIQGLHRGSIETECEAVLGMDIYRVKIKSEKVCLMLGKIKSGGENADLFEDSQCSEDNCLKCFLRGAFVALGTINEPQKGYHLEFRLKNAERAAFLYRLLSETGAEPKIANRRSGTGVGLYYKNSTVIEDLMTYLGSVKGIFELINVKIEREIRNSVNRSTNCLAGNISKSVNAAQKQVAAITALDKAGKLSLLPDELFETAKLRLANPSATLSELALMHEPPISKSGLTHRLAKILEISEENT